MPTRYVLRGTELRYTLTRLLQLTGQSSVTELVAALELWNFTVPGRPTKTVSDALRWEMQHDRVLRRGRGRYSATWMPRSTEHRIITRVSTLRLAAESLRGGHESPTPEDAEGSVGRHG
ncbi:hypothetical protein [Mycobacterium sp. M26]|uniref:hypothetical protein n=1 Tax=Mycobacterium sp. M26 TaxID=1762962 RepID=UPI000A933029|nr:hypothetical protein [Mycobacterium sp. M26]